MQCPYCSETIPDDSTFCPECGKDLTKRPARRPSWILIAVIVGALLVIIFILLLALGSIDESTSSTTSADSGAPVTSLAGEPSGAEVTMADGASAVPAVGDCFDEQLSVLVDCADPHYYELYVFTEYGAAGDEYPGEDALLAFVEQTCVAEFEVYVGAAYEESELDFIYSYPTADTWASGDRSVACLLSAGEEVTGSLQGSAR